MKKIALVSIALAMLAATPALARATHQNHALTYGQTDQGYYDASHVRNGDVPFAPF